MPRIDADLFMPFLRLTLAILFYAFPQLDLTSQRRQSKFDLFNFQLICFWIRASDKRFVCCESLLVFSKIIVGGGNEIVRDSQVWFRFQQPLVLGQRGRVLLECV